MSVLLEQAVGEVQIDLQGGGGAQSPGEDPWACVPSPAPQGVTMGHSSGSLQLTCLGRKVQM